MNNDKKNNNNYKIYVFIAIIITIAYFVLTMIYNSCVEENGPAEQCGLGSLCTDNCRPPYYMIVSLLFSAVYISAPIVLIMYLYKRYKNKNIDINSYEDDEN